MKYKVLEADAELSEVFSNYERKDYDSFHSFACSELIRPNNKKVFFTGVTAKGKPTSDYEAKYFSAVVADLHSKNCFLTKRSGSQKNITTALGALAQYYYILYATSGNSRRDTHARIVVPLREPVSWEEYKEISTRLKKSVESKNVHMDAIYKNLPIPFPTAKTNKEKKCFFSVIHIGDYLSSSTQL